MEAFSSQIVEQSPTKNEKKRFFELFDSFSVFLANTLHGTTISKPGELYSDFTKLMDELQNNQDSIKPPQKHPKEGNNSETPQSNHKKFPDRLIDLKKKPTHLQTASLDIEKKSRMMNKKTLPVSKTMPKPNNSRLLSAQKANGPKLNEIETSSSKRSKSKEVDHSTKNLLPPIVSPIRRQNKPEHHHEAIQIKYTENFFVDSIENTDRSQMKKKSKSVFSGGKKDNFNRQQGPFIPKNNAVTSTLIADINNRKMQIISKLRKKEG